MRLCLNSWFVNPFCQHTVVGTSWPLLTRAGLKLQAGGRHGAADSGGGSEADNESVRRYDASNGDEAHVAPSSPRFWESVHERCGGGSLGMRNTVFGHYWIDERARRVGGKRSGRSGAGVESISGSVLRPQRAAFRRKIGRGARHLPSLPFVTGCSAEAQKALTEDKGDPGA